MSFCWENSVDVLSVKCVNAKQDITDKLEQGKGHICMGDLFMKNFGFLLVCMSFCWENSVDVLSVKCVNAKKRYNR